jgi:hypothetical protein
MTNTSASYSITIPGDTSGTWATDTTTGLSITFCFGSGTTYQTTASTWQAGNFLATSTQTNFLATANAALNISDIQLEIGSTATTFEQRSYGLEFGLCQRYYQTGLYSSGLVGSGTTNAAGQVEFFMPMRVTPTVTQGGTYTITNGATSYGQSSASFTSTANPYKTAVNLANYTGLTSTSPYITDSGSSGFNASAEL